MTRRLRDWLSSLDDAVLRASAEPRAWAIATPVLVGLLLLASYGPGGELFGLRFVPAILWVAPNLCVAIALAFRVRRRTHVPLFDRALLALNSLGLQAFCASFIVLANERGGMVLAILFLLTASSHGYFYRSAPTQPFMSLGTALVALGAALFAPSTGHTLVVAFVGLTSVVGSLTLGSIAVGQDRARAEATRLREAVHAQIDRERADQVERLANSLVEVLGTNHDLGNALMSVTVNAGALVESVDTKQALDPEELRLLSADLADGVEQITRIAARARELGAGVAPAIAGEVVDPVAAAREATAMGRRRFPGCDVHVKADPVARARVRVQGGSATLRRVLDNLVLNACEGDGASRATRVEIRVRRDRSGHLLEISVLDDGPGFSESQLSTAIEGFATTKPGGTGLGLYTCERLVQASGGSLRRDNRASGGAAVRVSFPLVFVPSTK